MATQTLNQDQRLRMTKIRGRNKALAHIIFVSGFVFAGYAIHQRGGAHTAYGVIQKLWATLLQIVPHFGS